MRARCCRRLSLRLPRTEVGVEETRVGGEVCEERVGRRGVW